MTADAAMLDGLDPFALMDAEAARLDAFYASLPGDRWTDPTGCAAWDQRDLLAHLAACEEYNHACMADAVPAFLEQMGARGITDMNSFNAAGVADRADRSPAELLEEWRAACGGSRAWFRGHAGGELPTMVGPYPVDWQAVHLANELAIHADDAAVPVAPAEAAGRTAWLTQVARFLVAETDKAVSVEPVADGIRVGVDGAETVLSPARFVAAVNGRLVDDDLDPRLRSALSFMG